MEGCLTDAEVGQPTDTSKLLTTLDLSKLLREIQTVTIWPCYILTEAF